jgi:hypothetical protein
VDQASNIAYAHSAAQCRIFTKGLLYSSGLEADKEETRVNLEWSTITTEEAQSLKYSSRTGTEGQYQGLLDALEKGPIRIPVPKDSKLDSVKWAVGRAAKKAGVKISIATLDDKSGVVVTKVNEAPAPAVTPKPPADTAKK